MTPKASARRFNETAALEGNRRADILATAAEMFAGSGLRTSLQEIADACGILPGSLYHHFDSKEAIIVELVRQYRADLDQLAKETVAAARRPHAPEVEAQIVELGRSIAACGVQHRAALLLTLYEPPAVLGDEMAHHGRHALTAIQGAMLELLDQGHRAGVIRGEVDLALLSDRLCQSMLHVGVGVSHLTPGAEHVPEIRLRILLHGVAAKVPSDAALDRSASVQSVNRAISAWDDEMEDADERTSHLKAVARKEFGRRGFEATTMRDIAASAGLSTGTVYRSFKSKDELLLSIMQSYSRKARMAWEAALSPDVSAVEKLDGLMWANILVLDRFSDEFKIQLAWLRQSPPSTPNLGHWFTWHLRQIRAVLAEGTRSGQMHLDGATADVRARCLYEASVLPPSVIARGGLPQALALARNTVLRGAIVLGQR
jgi:AcrR family transcriptional regulator